METMKKILMGGAVAFLVVFWAVAVQSYSRDELRKYKDENIVPPNFTLQDTKGITHSLIDYRGKYVAIETGSST